MKKDDDIETADDLIADFEELEKEEGKSYNSSFGDITDRGDKFVIKIGLPEISEENISLEIKRNRISVRIIERFSNDTEDEQSYELDREIHLRENEILTPERIIPSKTKASFKNGILKIIAPKA